jgi:transketolase
MAEQVSELKERCRVMRKHIIECTTAAGSGHPSSSLSMVEILATLYLGGVLRYNTQDPWWRERDRLILSKGHGCPGLYVALAEAGFFPVEELMTLRKMGARLEGHPSFRRRVPGIEASTGSLGEGLSIGIGHALAARVDGLDYRVYVILGDGENDEGQVWEAAMAAAHHKIDNLTAIVDFNHRQQTGEMWDVLDIRPLADKWRAFGWEALEIDGHDLPQVADAFDRVRLVKGKPQALIARTVKGKGVSFMEGDFSWHGRAANKEQAAAALKELGF